MAIEIDTEMGMLKSITLPGLVALAPAKLTFCARVKRIGAWANYATFFWAKPNNIYDGHGWYLQAVSGEAQMRLFVDGANANEVRSFSMNTFYPLNAFVHIAATFDSDTAACTMYRNAVAQSVTVWNSSSPLTITGEEDAKQVGIDTYGNGCIAILDDIRLYNVVKSPDQVQNIAIGGADTSGLALWLKLNEGAAGSKASGSGTIKDSSGYARDGTPNENPVYRNGLWLPGRKRLSSLIMQ